MCWITGHLEAIRRGRKVVQKSASGYNFCACSSRGRVRLQTDVIIHGVPEPLFATEVPLGRLHRNVAEQELDLFQFTACLAAQPRTGPSQIVWCH
jgi:hypothetical protein